jgi:hypothetical protein
VPATALLHTTRLISRVAYRHSPHIDRGTLRDTTEAQQRRSRVPAAHPRDAAMADSKSHGMVLEIRALRESEDFDLANYDTTQVRGVVYGCSQQRSRTLSEKPR